VPIYAYRADNIVLVPDEDAGVVDVVYVNIVTWYVGCVRMGKLAKGGAVVSRPGIGVDGYSRHEQRS
jgi:hypothetical protein